MTYKGPYPFPHHLKESSYKEHHRSGSVPRTKISVFPAIVSFNTLYINSASPAKRVLVKNTGELDVKISGVRVAGDYTVSHNAPVTLRPDESFLVSIVFSPTAYGPRQGGVYIDTGDAAGNEYISLMGYGYIDGDTPSDDDSDKANAAAIGITPTANDLGNFINNIIPDNQTVKAALELLGTTIENGGGGGGNSGPPGLNALGLSVLCDRKIVVLSQAGSPNPANQDITLVAYKQNTDGQITWSIQDGNGSPRVPTSSYLSTATGDVVIMTTAQFMAAKGNTAGVTITATLPDNALSARENIVVVTEGPQGPDGPSGIDGFDGKDGIWKEFVWKRAATKPAAPTGSGIPSGWYDKPPEGTDPLWMSQSRQELDGTLVTGTTWSDPIRHDGPPGEDGKDALGYIQEANPGTPASPHQWWYRPSTKVLYYWNGTAWTPSMGNLSRFDTILAEHIGARQILADHLSTNTLITVSAQIGDGLIRNAQIGNLEVTNAKIANLEVGTSKIANQALTQNWGWNVGSTLVGANNTETEFFNQTFTVPEFGFQSELLILYALIQHGVISGGNVTGNDGLNHELRWYITPAGGSESLIINRIILNPTANSIEYSLPITYGSLPAGVTRIRGTLTVGSGADVNVYRVHSASPAIIGYRK